MDTSSSLRSYCGLYQLGWEDDCEDDWEEGWEAYLFLEPASAYTHSLDWWTEWWRERWRERWRVRKVKRLSKEGIRLDKKSREPKVLFDFLRTLWGLLDTIIELIQTVRVHIILILDTFFTGFSEFPNSMRPPCTTMPWTIWPALLVLWGVCWMFYTPLSPADEQQFDLSLLDEWTLFPNAEAPFDPLGASFLTHQGISDHSVSGELNYPPDSFEWLNEMDFAHSPASGVSNGAHEGHFKNFGVSPLPHEGPPQNIAQSTDFLGASSLVEQQMATAPANKPFSMPSLNLQSAIVLSTGASTKAEQSASSSCVSTASIPPKQLPQNSDGKMTCDHIDCSNQNLTFTRTRDWLKHKNKHNRPYKCSVDGCPRTQGFATKGDQIRHERGVHKMLNSVAQDSSSITLFSCDEPNCPRTGNAGFPRRDNLADHMKRRHGRIPVSSRAPAVVMNSSTPFDNQRPALLQPEEQQMSSLIAVPAKRRRASTTAQSQGVVDTEDPSVGKKARQEESDSNSDPQPTAREEALIREVERLRKELEKSQKERDVLIGALAKLT